MKFTKSFSIFNLLFRWRKIMIETYTLKWKMKGDFDERYFCYTAWSEDVSKGELEFTNEMSGEVLIIQREDLSFHRMKLDRVYEN